MKKILHILSLCLLLTVLIGAPLSVTRADDVEDLQRQIEERNENIKKLEEEIAKYKAEADKTSAAAMTLANTIKTLQSTGKKLDADIKLTQAKISATSLTINKLGEDIISKEEHISKSKEDTAESLRLLNQGDKISFVQSFLQSKDITEAWKVIQNILSIQAALRGHIDDLENTKQNLAEDKSENEKKKEELSEFQKNLSDQKTVVSQNTQEKNTLLSQTKNQEAEYQRIIREKAAAKAAFEKELYEYEAKLKYVLDPSSIPQKGSAVFAWPTDEVYITQNFGITSASGRLYASGSHNGVDFKALMGTPIKAMGDGVVIGAGNTDLTCPRASFGQWILIKYSNGLSAIFAHLSVISVKEGDSVRTGQIVGYSGNTGYSTGPHLHVGVYASDAVKVENRPSVSCGGKVYRMPIAPVDAYLDPLAYLPKL